MYEFRVTFPERYGKGSPGHEDPSARQGHYVEVEAENARSAWNKVHERFPFERIEVQPWKPVWLPADCNK